MKTPFESIYWLPGGWHELRRDLCILGLDSGTLSKEQQILKPVRPNCKYGFQEVELYHTIMVYSY